MKKALIIPMLLLMLIGCTPKTPPLEDKLVDEDKIAEVVKWKTVIKEVYKTNWLATVFIIAIVACGIAAFNGFKKGWGIIIWCGVGLVLLASYQAIASHPWLPYIAGGIVLLTGFGWLGWTLFVKNRALLENVKTTETVKKMLAPIDRVRLFGDDNAPLGSYERDGKIAATIQHSSTRKLVAQNRAKLEKIAANNGSS